MNISVSLGLLYLLSPGALGSTPPRYSIIDSLCKLANLRYTSPLLVILHLFVPCGSFVTPLGGTSPFYPIIFTYRPSARDPTQIPVGGTVCYGRPDEFSYSHIPTSE
ncbi:uncharacterized protein EI90DRAFT_3081088 [Cantharellus anzutake]|uniref:uncharacterized protein n=1 Tax=Cantharellus anzutake TaxID=1750568 RepID=UPI0019057A5B|nr:uncharacterized protein EI90DRAFT_3081088 [Cantharellus anzutake]KAF8320227.1 hypothetical protein EI90DRAFT_3081088 [Cantharellus anzutake]